MIFEHHCHQSPELWVPANLLPLKFPLQQDHESLSCLCLCLQVLSVGAWDLEPSVELSDPKFETGGWLPHARGVNRTCNYQVYRVGANPGIRTY